VALTVVDPYQGRGIGHLLLNALVLAAVQAGYPAFEGEILGENLAIRAGARRRRRRIAPERARVRYVSRSISRPGPKRYARIRCTTYSINLALGASVASPAEPWPCGVSRPTQFA